MARIFFGIMLPDTVRENLIRLHSLFAVQQGAVRWVEKQNLHLTLQFIGEIPEDKVRKILSDAARAAALADHFDLEIKGIGAFPGPARPRVLWAGVSKGENQARLLAGVLSRSLGIVPDKPFSPHITLGRVREGHPVRVSDALSSGREYAAGTVTVESFACLGSTLTPNGPVYREIAVFHLR